jgi:hypothetical protein
VVPELQVSWSSPTGTGSLREVIPAARFTPATDLYTGTSVSGGAFSIAGVPVALGTVRALASASTQSGMVGDYAPIGGATTTVGAITLRKVLFSATSAGGFHTCGIDLSGKGYCWGGNQYGKLGTGDEADRDRPAPIAGSLSFRKLSPSRFIATADNADPSYTCGVTTAQAGYCWGQNNFGRLGTGLSANELTPKAVDPSLSLSWQTINAGDFHACGATPSGAAYCWGKQDRGQLGDGIIDLTGYRISLRGSQ